MRGSHRCSHHQRINSCLLCREEGFVLHLLLRGGVDEVRARDIGAVHAVARADRADDDVEGERLLAALRADLGGQGVEVMIITVTTGDSQSTLTVIHY